MMDISREAAQKAFEEVADAARCAASDRAFDIEEDINVVEEYLERSDPQEKPDYSHMTLEHNSVFEQCAKVHRLPAQGNILRIPRTAED